MLTTFDFNRRASENGQTRAIVGIFTFLLGGWIKKRFVLKFARFHRLFAYFRK
jgi:hypothetical protein